MRRSHQSAFTLAEVLVSIAILSMLIVLFSQIFSAATASTSRCTKHLDADSQARLVFDRMADDFSNMLMRKDVDYYFSKQTPGNDTMFFFSQAPGCSGTSTTPKSVTSLVGYRINPTTLQLERLSKQLDWDGSTGTDSMVFLTYTSGTNLDLASTIATKWATTIPPTSTDDNYRVMGDGIFRLEFCFLETPTPAGTASPYVDPPSPTPGNYPFQFTTSGTTTTVTGIVVTIAILDTTSRIIAPNMSGLVSTLTDQTNTPPLMAWNSTIQALDFAAKAGIPATAASQVRVYQRTFYFNTLPNVTIP